MTDVQRPSALGDSTLWLAATARFPVGAWQAESASKIPRSSGLAGSTAMLAAMLACALTVRGQPPDLSCVQGKAAFAETVRDVELREAGIVCGYQDAYMAVFGGLQRMDFAGKHPWESGPHAQLRQLVARRLPFLLVTTGVERLSGSVHGPIRERWLAGDPEVVGAMRRIAELGKIGADAFESEDWARLAEAMTENHRLVASLGGSGEEVDRLVAACKHCGARAAKLAGAGRGGTVIALADDPDSLRTCLQERGYTRFFRPEPTPGLRVERSPLSEMAPLNDAQTSTRKEPG